MSSGSFGLAVGFDGFDFYTTSLSEAVSMPKKSSLKYVEFINSKYKI